MYNEFGTPIWDITEKNDNFIRINVKGEGKNTFGIDIVKKSLSLDDFFLDILDNVYSQESGFVDVWAAGEIKFAMCYNNHNGTPFLKQSTDATKGLDLYVITYLKNSDMELISERNRRFNILYTSEDKERGLIHIIATAKMDNEPYLYLTYREQDENGKFIYTTKHVITNKNKEDVNIYVRKYTEEEVAKSRYSKSILGDNNPKSVIKLAKTVIPYSVIIYPFSNEVVRKELCEKRYNKHSNYTKYINSENAQRNLMAEIKRVRSEKYSAATFYIDKPFEDVTVEDMENTIGIDRFQRVNFLCQDGKVKSL